jgi:hypothetical protein
VTKYGARFALLALVTLSAFAELGCESEGGPGGRRAQQPWLIAWM